MVVGSLWRTTSWLRPEILPPDVEPHEFQYVFKDPWYNSNYPTDGMVIPIGTLAVYAGTVRVTESEHGRPLRIPRRSFIIQGNRFLTLSLLEFVPLLPLPHS